MKSIAIMNQKGGVGKTSATIEIATLLASKSKTKVAVIDLDGQRNTSMYAGADIEAPYTIYDTLNADCTIEEAIQKTQNGFDILIGDRRLSTAQKHFTETDDTYLLADLMELMQEYDYVIVDCPPQRGVLQEMAIIGCNYCIGITKVDDGGLVGLKELNADIVAKRKRNLSNIEVLGLVYNDYANTNADIDSIITLKDIAAEMNTKIFDTLIRHSIKISECKKNHKALVLFDSRNNLAEDYKNLVKEIEKRIKLTEKRG